jgi:hypothetical protein
MEDEPMERPLSKTVPTEGCTFIRSLMPKEGGFGAKDGAIGVVYMVIRALKMVKDLRENKDLMQET